MCICALQALPGCEFYTLTNLNLWLQTHQYNNKPYRDKNDKNEAPRNSSAYCYPPSIRFKPQTNTIHQIVSLRSPPPCAHSSLLSSRLRSTATLRLRRLQYGQACSLPPEQRATRWSYPSNTSRFFGVFTSLEIHPNSIRDDYYGLLAHISAHSSDCHRDHPHICVHIEL